MKALPLKMTEESAKKHYPTASPEIKAMLEDTFTKEFFSMKITDRVKTFEDACKIKGVNPDDVLPYHKYSSPFEIALNGIAKIWTIIEVINEGWVADMTDTNQPKFYPWFEQRSGSGLSYLGYVTWRSSTYCGVRFALKNKENAIYVGKQFISIYEEFSIIK